MEAAEYYYGFFVCQKCGMRILILIFQKYVKPSYQEVKLVRYDTSSALPNLLGNSFDFNILFLIYDHYNGPYKYLRSSFGPFVTKFELYLEKG